MRKPSGGDTHMGKDNRVNSKDNNNDNKNSTGKLRKGLWSPEEDEKLLRYMLTNGQGCWSDIARGAGLQRCGKSCRLRWINYLRPDLKRGAFSPQEEELIIHLHTMLGNRYRVVSDCGAASRTTDNEIKNFWNSTLKKRLKTANSITPSPNGRHVSSDPKDIFGGIVPIQEHDIMAACIDSSSLPPVAFQPNIQNMFAGNQLIDPLFLATQGNNDCYSRYDILGGAGYFDAKPECIAQARDFGDNNDYSYWDFVNSVPGKMEFGLAEFSLPPFSSEEMSKSATGLSCSMNNTNNDDYNRGSNNGSYFSNDNCFNNTADSSKAEGRVPGGLISIGNHLQGGGPNLKMGEWDLEGFMDDISSSCPLLDF